MNSIILQYKPLFFILIIWMNTTAPSFSQDSLPSASNSNSWSIGVRFSNPAGITIKKYFNDNALELIAGRPSTGKYYNYLQRYDHYRMKGYNLIDYDIISHPWSIQLHYLVHKKSNMFRGLSLYYGAGGQFRTGTYYHVYYTVVDSQYVYNEEKMLATGVGTDGVIGIDYTFKRIPLTVFLDMSAYIEVFPHPLYMNVITGSGIRYNF
jgi:hypothetical protein